MSVTAERKPRSLVSLQIEVEPERLEAEVEKAARRLAQQVKIPGFRPGKAPRAVIERTIGRPAILQEAIEELLPNVYNEALESEQIDAIGQPEIDLKSTEPLIVEATVAVRPSVDLRAYRELRVPSPNTEATDEQIEEALTALLRRYATLDPVDRAVAWGDTVRADVRVQVDGQDEPYVEEGAEFPVREGTVVSLPGFLEQLLDLERGGPHTFEFNLPDDYQAQELAGKLASYELTIHEVKQEILPDLDDEFAVSLDEEGIDTAEQVRERVSDNVRAQVAAEAEGGYRDEIVDVLLATAEIEYPEVLVDREIDRLVDEQSNHAAHTQEELDRWLEAIGQTEQEVRDSLREHADLSVRRAIVLGEFAAAEGIEVLESDIQQEVEQLVEQMSQQLSAAGRGPDEVRTLVDTEQMRGSIRNQLMTKQALDRLVEIASQEDEGEAAEPRRGSRRRRGQRGAEADVPDSSEPSTGDAPSEGSTEPQSGDND